MSIIHFIGAGPGDPDLITVKGRRLIEEAPVVLYAGSLVPRGVVDCARKDARVIDTAPLHLDEIIAELRSTKTSERAGRAMDHEREDAFERLRASGYM